MREPAQAFLRDVESQPRSPEAGVAHRVYGVTQWFAGDFIEARSHLEQAVAIFDPERDRDLAFRFGQDVGVSAMVYLAIVLWPLGEVERARELVDATATQIAELGHLATSTYGLMHNAMFEIIGRNVDRAAPLAKALSSVARAWDCPVDRFRGLPGSLGGTAIRLSGNRSLEHAPGRGPASTGWRRRLSAARQDSSGGSGSAKRRDGSRSGHTRASAQGLRSHGTAVVRCGDPLHARRHPP